MSRSGYSDNDGVQLWRGAVKRAIEGSRGQTFLMELVASLDALPEKKLASNSFTKGGAICSLGSVALRRGVDVSQFEPKNTWGEYDEPADRDALGTIFGIAPAMIAEIMYENDEGAWWSDKPESPEHRWQRMRDWASALLLNSQASDAGESK